MFGTSETGIISTITSKEVSQTSRGYGLGCGTSARPPLGQNRKDILAPRKLEVKGWVSEC